MWYNEFYWLNVRAYQDFSSLLPCVLNNSTKLIFVQKYQYIWMCSVLLLLWYIVQSNLNVLSVNLASTSQQIIYVTNLGMNALRFGARFTLRGFVVNFRLNGAFKKKFKNGESIRKHPKLICCYLENICKYSIYSYSQ